MKFEYPLVNLRMSLKELKTFYKHMKPEACLPERVPATTRQRSLYLQHKLWRALARTRAAERASVFILT